MLFQINLFPFKFFFNDILVVQFFKSTISNCSQFEKLCLWSCEQWCLSLTTELTVRKIYTFITVSHILWYMLNKLIVWHAVGKTSNCCLVMAQLITQGKKRGIHLFFLQLRDLETHRLMPGIDIQYTLSHCSTQKCSLNFSISI